jgi:hypothetical protein
LLDLRGILLDLRGILLDLHGILLDLRGILLDLRTCARILSYRCTARINAHAGPLSR